MFTPRFPFRSSRKTGRRFRKSSPRSRLSRCTRRPLFEPLEDRCLLATFAVTSFDDGVDANPGDGISDDGTGHSTLRSAIMETNATRGPDIIELDAGTYTLTRSGQGEDSAASGDLDIRDNLTIVGVGSDRTVIDANKIDGVLHVFNTASLTLMDLSIRGGSVLGEREAGRGGGAVPFRRGPGRQVDRLVQERPPRQDRRCQVGEGREVILGRRFSSGSTGSSLLFGLFP